MKKRVWLSMMAACAVMTLSACGTAAEKSTETQESTESTADSGDAAKESAETENSTADDSATRLVSVDDVSKYVTIAEYKGLELEKVVDQVLDEDVETQIESNLSDSRTEITDTDVAAENNDLVTIDFEGLKDGVAFDGGTSSDYELELGSGLMIDGFEDGIVGMKIGETKELDLTFPDYYPEESLAGEAVVFRITLNAISRAPELTDEWVAANTDSTTVEEYKESVRKQLEEDADTSAEYTLYATAWQTVLDNSEFTDYPQKDIDDAVTELKQLYQNYADQADMTLDEFIESMGYTTDQFDEDCQTYAQSKVKQNLLVQGIMDAEGMSLDDAQCLALQEQLIADTGVSDLAELVDIYGQAAVDEAIGLLRVEQFITDNATISTKVSNGDQTGEDADADEADAEADAEEDADEVVEISDEEEAE